MLEEAPLAALHTEQSWSAATKPLTLSSNITSYQNDWIGQLSTFTETTYVTLPKTTWPLWRNIVTYTRHSAYGCSLVRFGKTWLFGFKSVCYCVTWCYLTKSVGWKKLNVDVWFHTGHERWSAERRSCVRVLSQLQSKYHWLNPDLLCVVGTCILSTGSGPPLHQ